MEHPTLLETAYEHSCSIDVRLNRVAVSLAQIHDRNPSPEAAQVARAAARRVVENYALTNAARAAYHAERWGT